MGVAVESSGSSTSRRSGAICNPPTAVAVAALVAVADATRSILIKIIARTINTQQE